MLSSSLTSGQHLRAWISPMWGWFRFVWVVYQSEGGWNDCKWITLPTVVPSYTLLLDTASLFSSWAPKLLHIPAVNATPTVCGYTSWTLTITLDTFSSCTRNQTMWSAWLTCCCMWCLCFLSCITSWYRLWFLLWSGNQWISLSFSSTSVRMPFPFSVTL